MNPFAGLRGRPMWQGLKALDSLDRLVAEASAEQCYQRCGVLRPASSQMQADSFRAVADAWPKYATWLEADALHSRFRSAGVACGALHLRSGGVMDTPRLIKAVMEAAVRNGAKIRMGTCIRSWGATPQMAFVLTEDGRRYHASCVLLCLGSGYKKFSLLNALNLHRTKGQVVRVPRPAGYDILMPISGHGYIVPEQHELIVGTTYERGFTTEAPTAAASRNILRQASAMVPRLDRLTPLSAAAGVRVGVPGTRLPMVGPIADRIWVLTGLGSKGLLLAALLSRMLPDLMKSRSPIPREVQVSYRNSKKIGQPYLPAFR